MRIVPAIDIINGRCVRLTKGDYASTKVYDQNPLDVARRFEDAGLSHLHLVDLDGAKAGRVVNWPVVESLARETSLAIDFGGGVKTDEEIGRLFDLNVRQVNLGSIAVRQPEKVFEWIEKYGAGKIILSADVRNETVAINGWQENAGMPVGDFIDSFMQKGMVYVTCTDIDTDGTLSGPNITLYKKLITRFPGIRLTASGGVGKKEDLLELRSTGVFAAIVGKAIYENNVTLNDLIQIENAD